ncbi:hypothetical protein QRD40_21740 [Comamonas sp. Y6]|uniref:DUF2244 domain-containing protein n=1 Tax=Comamonas resistens TaxID=3046670 RepID=A0ABY8T0T3_9BURK|nr:hypothetical protein [Comamonas resistens]MDL5038966.1 hypothetical protein [Comamonas resistens]WHS67819.1 hypothetical protein QMY55_12165 [Comamonas resistens]
MTLLNPILVKSQLSFSSAYLSFGMIVFGLLLGFFDTKYLFVSVVFGGFGLISLWGKVIAHRREVTLDAAAGQVTISRVSAFFRPKQRSYPLEMFGSVQSYILQGKFPINRVELVTKTGGEALMLALFEPANVASSFFSLPREGENKLAERLRQEIAGQLGLLDRGFLGNRMFGAQLKD